MPCYFDPGAVNAAVVAAESDLAPDVVRIWWDYGSDWCGKDALFFRVVLSDDAAANRRREVVNSVMRRLGGHSLGLGLGLFGYISVRSESECQELNEAGWMAT
jgi:hypothetical protein